MRKIILTMVSMMGLLGFSAAANAVPVQNANNGHWYELIDSMIWTDAEQYAIDNYNGHLVTINDAAEEDWLQATFGFDTFWIGFNDAAIEGTWEWASGEAVSYTNWFPGVPDNLFNEDYAIMNGGQSNVWDDEANSYIYQITAFYSVNKINEHMSIVEYSRVPEPATLGLLGLGLLGMGLIRRRKTA